MRIKTGIPNLGKLIEGGIPRGNTVLVSGDYGTGKTTLAIQYLMKGVIDYGEFGILVTFVDDRGDILRDARRFGWHVRRFEKEGSIRILGGPPDRMAGFGDEAKKSGQDLVEEIVETIDEMEAERLALDGLEEFSKLFESEVDFKAGMAKLRRELRERECTSILTSRPDIGIEEIVDGIIILHYDGMELEKTRAVEVIKMRRSRHTDRVCPFEITDKGIVVTGYPVEEEEEIPKEEKEESWSEAIEKALRNTQRRRE